MKIQLCVNSGQPLAGKRRREDTYGANKGRGVTVTGEWSGPFPKHERTILLSPAVRGALGWIYDAANFHVSGIPETWK